MLNPRARAYNFYYKADKLDKVRERRSHFWLILWMYACPTGDLVSDNSGVQLQMNKMNVKKKITNEINCFPYYLIYIVGETSGVKRIKEANHRLYTGILLLVTISAKHKSTEQNHGSLKIRLLLSCSRYWYYMVNNVVGEGEGAKLLETRQDYSHMSKQSLIFKPMLW